MSSPLLSCVTSEGGLLPPEILHRILAQDRGLPGLTPGDYHLDVRLGEAASRAWSALQPSWRAFRTQLEKLPVDDTGTTVTREKWLLPLFRELSFGWLTPKHGQFMLEGEPYPFSHGYGHVPMHLLGARVSLDKKERGLAGAARMSPHGLVQQFLNRSHAHLWGIASNGVTLRLLRDHYSLSTTAYVEFDLEEMFNGGLYSEFLLLFLLLHQSRYEAQKPAEMWLEAWFKEGQKEGVAALDKLGLGARSALTELGTGFIRHPENGELRNALKDGGLGRDVYYRELLRILYRLLFLFVAEDRQALLLPEAPPDAKERFSRYYGTRRLRDLAFRSRGTAHHDLWEQLRLVFDGLWEGEPLLALPALGSGLFDPRQLPHLSAAKLSNVHLMAALRTLTEITEGGRRIRVSYRNLGAQELGSVYESLLELHPVLNVDAGKFELASAAGNERKTTGSYYTPVSLVECLLDSALDPVVDAAVKGKTAKQAEDALLELKVCDPACGSGHFLVAAARRIADRLARARTPDEEPSPEQRQHALRDVVGHCLFGVDANPMAVELCKVSLWMEAIEPGRPLSFLDAHIQCGNALLGATPALIARGIPEQAFEALDGDDNATTVALRRQNKKERDELTLDFSVAPRSTFARLGEGARGIDAAADDSLGALRMKEQTWVGLVTSAWFKNEKFLADLWCASFVWRKEPGLLRELAPTEATFKRVSTDPTQAPSALRDEVERLAQSHGFFHWHLAFPQVLRPRFGPVSDADSHCFEGGFDLILGNPPWDKLTPDPTEFFSGIEPDIRFQPRAEKDRTIERLTQDPTLLVAWRAHQRLRFAEIHFIKSSGRYRLFAPGNLGKGDLNTYRMFVELALETVRVSGYVSQVVPEGFYNGANCMAIREALFTRYRLHRLLACENHREAWFPGIDSRAKFVLYVASRDNASDRFSASFNIRSVPALESANREGALELPVEMIRIFSPDALAVMEFESQFEIDIARKMYARCPRFGDDSAGPPHAQVAYELHMTNDSGRFQTKPSGLPVYEGRMVDQFDYRAKGYREGRGRAAVWEELPFGRKAVEPQWWVALDALPIRLRTRVERFRIGFCDVASPTNERSMIAALLPPGVVAGNKVPTITFDPDEPETYLVWLAVANSFAMDFIVRKKVSLQLSFTLLDSLPFPRPPTADPCVAKIVPLAASLTCTGQEMEPFWNALQARGHILPTPTSASMGLADRGARLGAMAKLEAIVCRDVFGLARDEVSYLLDTFPIVRRREEELFGEYRTKRLVLEAMSRVGGIPTATLPFLASTRESYLAAVPSGSLARPRTNPRHEAMSAIVALLKRATGPMPARHLRLAATLVLEPRWLVPHLDAEQSAVWRRAVGTEGDALPNGVHVFVPAADGSWGAALKQLRGSGRLVEDTAADTWAAGSRLEGIDTAGWPDGRARYVLDLLQRLGVDAIVANLPPELRRSLDASAA